MHRITITLTDAQCKKLTEQKGKLDHNAYATKLVVNALQQKNTDIIAQANVKKAKSTQNTNTSSRKSKEK